MEATTNPLTPSSLTTSVPLICDKEVPFEAAQNKPLIPDVLPVVTPSITDVKMQKIFYGIIATISISIGYIALVIGSAASVFLAIPALTAGGLLVWNIIRMRDYADPIELQNYRLQANRQPLEVTAKEHGWDNMFRFGIPAQADFDKLYAAHVKNRNFRDGTLIAAYETLNTCRETCIAQGKTVQIEIPHPSTYQEKFLGEIEGKTLCDIFKDYPVEQLIKYGLLANDKLPEFVNYLAAHTTRNEALKKEEAEFVTYRNKLLYDYEMWLKAAKPQTTKQQGWIEAALQQVASLRNPHNQPVMQYEITDEELGSLKELKDAYTSLRKTLDAAKEVHEKNLKGIEARLKATIDNLNKIKVV